MEIDELWKLVAAPFAGQSIHGPSHWRRVERNGLLLASRTGANPAVVRLFALFHDSRRLNDDDDPGHGARGAEYATQLRDNIPLCDDDFALLKFACTWHTDSDRHENPTIATSWDADRLDLGRVGIIPDPRYLSTAFGREIAAAGSVERYLASRT